MSINMSLFSATSANRLELLEGLAKTALTAARAGAAEEPLDVWAHQRELGMAATIAAGKKSNDMGTVKLALVASRLSWQAVRACLVSGDAPKAAKSLAKMIGAVVTVAEFGGFTSLTVDSAVAEADDALWAELKEWGIDLDGSASPEGNVDREELRQRLVEANQA